MSESRPLKIVLTGGPCAGKTTIINYLAAELSLLDVEVFVRHETATALHNMGISLREADPLVLQQRILQLQFINENVIEAISSSYVKKGVKSVIICDRGPMDSLAYVDETVFNNALYSFAGSRFEALSHYDAVLHLVTAANGAEKFYSLDSNNARTETIEQARAIDIATAEAWVGSPHLRIFDNSQDFEGKKRSVLAEVKNLLGIGDCLEIERKWLLDNEEVKAFFANPPTKLVTVRILQVYLTDGSRIRSRSPANSPSPISYTHTYKEEISAGICVETEKKITSAEYSKLLQSYDTGYSPILKMRCMFLWNNRYWELDEFSDNERLFYVLETEFRTDEGLANVETPPYFGIIRDVTNDSSFKNKNMARDGWPASTYAKPQ